MTVNVGPSSYPLADLSKIGIEYAQVFARPAMPAVAPSQNPTNYTLIGECDYFKWSLNTTWAKMFSKSQRVASQIKNVATKIEASVSFKSFSIGDFIRLYAMCGKAVQVVQVAATGKVYPSANTAGVTTPVPAQNGLFRMGFYNIGGAVSVTLNGQALPAANWQVVDSALGVIAVVGLSGAQLGQPLGFTFDIGSYSATKTKGGMILGQALEFIVRGVSDEGQKGYLQLLNCPVGPKGDMDQISANDSFQSVELEGAPLLALDDEGEYSLGCWSELDA